MSQQDELNEIRKEQCPFCRRSSDEDEGGEDWIECTKCKQWLHIVCAAIDPVPPQDDPWYCVNCLNNEDSRSLSEETVVSVNSNNNNMVRNQTETGLQNGATETEQDVRDRESRLLAEIISEKEEILKLKKRQLELLRPNIASGNDRVNEWLNASGDNPRQQPDQHNPPPATIPAAVLNSVRHPRRPPRANSGERDCVEIPTMRKLLESQMKMMSRQYLEELPIFDGDEELWPTFYTQFKTTTEEGGFNDAHNLCRLRKCLKGEAMNAVIGTINLPNSLPDVLRILEKRFGNQELFVRNKFKKFHDLTPPNENKPITIKHFYEFLQNFAATLKNAGATRYLESPQTLDDAVEKLPAGMSRSWLMHTRNLKRDAGLAEFINWFEPYYDCAIRKDREHHHREHQDHHQPATKRYNGRVNYNQESEYEQEKTGSKPKEIIQFNRQSEVSKCGFCKQEKHSIVQCAKFKKLHVLRRWRFIRQYRWCFVCLLSKHHRQDCRVSKACGVNNCQELHHELLHNENIDKKEASVHCNQELSASSLCQEDSTSYSRKKTHFRMLPVNIFYKNKYISTWAFLDEGSSLTMLRNDLADVLNVDGAHEELCTSWTDNSVRKEQSRRVTVELSGLNMSKKFKLSNVRTVSQLSLPVPDFNLKEMKTKYNHLRDIEIPDFPFERPGILIGLEHSKLGLMKEIREGGWNEPVASRTVLGWAIHGKEEQNSTATEYSYHVCECSDNNDAELHEAVREYFTTEQFGVRLREKPLEARDVERAREMLEKTTRKCDDFYETGLLWRSNDIKLSADKNMAMRRLICFEKKLNKDPVLKAAVEEKLAAHIAKGYIRKLTNEDLSNIGPKRWYLPVFATSNVNKPGKTRLVFDAAAIYNGMSLNGELLKGPDQMASLFGVLLRFREERVAVTGDIAEMFHRIRIIPEDQKFQLILWRNMDDTKLPDTYAVIAMTFGATCSPSSAQYVKNLNASKYTTTHPRAVEAIIKRHYVDDLLDSFTSEEEALKIANDIRNIHSEAAFVIRNWRSNSSRVMNELNKETNQNSPDVAICMPNETDTEKVLGLYWNMKKDTFTFHLNLQKIDERIRSKSQVPTKREILQIIMSVYDPLGMLSIVTITAKIFMQDVWRSGIHWDDNISQELVLTWFNWLDAIQNLKDLHIPRCFKPQHIKFELQRTELHVFADSSEQAFAAAVYVRLLNDKNEAYVTLVAAKTRVAPQKGLSVARLELQAAVLANRLKDTVIEEMSYKFDEIEMWSDSQTVLGWIRSTNRKYSTFVAHRVGEILDTSTINQWRYVPSADNVADDATRLQEFPVVTKRWISGPEFLYTPRENWPTEKVKIVSTEQELKRVCVHNKIENPYQELDCARFSKWERMLRCMGYVLKYIESLRRRIQNKTRGKLKIIKSCGIKELVSRVPALDVNEINNAEEILFKKVQFESYYDELMRLKHNGGVLSKSSNIYNFNPCIDNRGLIRLAGRLDAAPHYIEEDLRRPILLERQHQITILLIEAVHRKFKHVCKENVVNEVRQRLWIPKLRITLNSIISKCNYCAYNQAKPKIPKMSPLPAHRLEPFKPPFTNTGVDFFGPMQVVVGRRKEKRWGVVFTCLSSRAIHIELASTLDTSSAILCFRNFINRRGTPKKMISDNGTNLRGVEKELREAVKKLDANVMQNNLINMNPAETRMEWIFIPPAAPHFGGCWERMIRTIKKTLYAVLKEKCPRDEILRSALIEVENLVNSRPLTYVTEDIDAQESITPNHLLRNSNLQQSINVESTYNYRRQWKLAQCLAEEFWRRWLKEYVPTISKRSKWYDENEPLEVGKLVLIMDDNVPRGNWRKAIVTKVVPGKDGRIRIAHVRTGKGEYIRPVAKLAVININTEY